MPERDHQIKDDLAHLINIVDQLLGIFPAKTGVGDGLTIDVAVAADLLAAAYNVALDHQTLHHGFDLRVVVPAVKYLVADADLFHVLLVGI